MAEWEYKTVSQDPPGPFRKVFVDRREVQSTLEQAVLDLRKRGWVTDEIWDLVGPLDKLGIANIEELGCWHRIAKYRLKRKKEDSK